MAFVSNIIESVLIVWFETSFVKIDKNKKVLLIPLILIDAALILLCNAIDPVERFLTSYLIMINAIFIGYISYTDFIEVFLICCFEAGYLSFVNGIVLSINCLFPVLIEELDALSKILYFILAPVVIRKLKFFCFDKVMNYTLVTILFTMQFIVTEFYLYYVESIQTEYASFNVTFVMIETGLLAMVILLMKISDMNKESQSYHQLLLEMNNIKQDYSIYDKIRIYKHDLIHAYSTLLYYLKMQDYAAVYELISTKQEEIKEIPSLIKCSNQLVQSILNQKLKMAYFHHLEMQCDVSIEEKVEIRDDDLSTLLCNILDNAIENCAERGIIKVRIVQNCGILYITVINPVNEFVGLYTKKKDKDLHGIGLKSVEQIIKIYDGFQTMEIKDNSFKITISLICSL